MPKHDHLHTLPITERYPEDIWDTLNDAATAHENQQRKAEKQWYIVHPFSVFEKVREVTDDRNVQKAALLHDTVEDTEMTIDDIEQKYGPEVACMVWGVTKDDNYPDWYTRNNAYLQRLEYEAMEGSVIVALADKIDNLTDMVNNHQKYGEQFWQHFNAQPLDQLWWYTSVLQVGKKRLPGCPLNQELEQLVEAFCVLVVSDMAAQRQSASETLAYALS